MTVREAPPIADTDPAERVGVGGRLVLLAGSGALLAVLGVWMSGAAVPGYLRDPGAAVRWGLPVVTTLTELAGSLTLGALVLAVCVLPRRAVAGAGSAGRAGATGASTLGLGYARSLVLAGVAAAVWTVLSMVQLVLTYASVSGRPPDSATFGEELGVFVTQIDLGRTLILVTTLAAVVTALALLVATPTGAAWTALIVVVGMWQQAQTGHAAGSASHDLATTSMFMHLVGAAVWIGALAALAVLLGRLGPDLAPAVARYSVIAGWCFAAVAVSGLVNAVVRVGGLDGMASRYGALVVVKAVLFGALGLLGLMHRRSVIPRLGDGGRPRRLFWRLVGVELAVMGAVSGVAAALGSTPPPVPDEPVADPTPAEIVTGHVLPPEPTVLRWLTEWRWDLLFAFAAVAGIVVYLRWVRRLRRRGDAWPVSRTVLWVAGMALFFWTTSGGPATYGHVLFSAHMVQHMILAMVIPILLALAAPVTLALRALPSRSGSVRGDGSRGPREWLLVLVHSRIGQFFANPIVAAVNFAGSMIVFYYTEAFEWALTSSVGHIVMVVHFSLAGYLFANGLIGIDPGPRRPPYPQRILVLFGTMAFHAFFGVTLLNGESLLVADYFGLLGREWGPSAIADQQKGGGVAWGIGELPTLALAVGVAVSWARDDERVARRRDRRVDRDGDVEMDEYNAMLARMSERDGSQPR
ncbi:cytochrome c oxidase assembly protein [Cellulomonas chengniuliangii]|uniref:Bifunctional copper resistance protein CopD/cytochrome c oxidase assembly protein n=1 Tax=Cellulomonas chengniuliangii TaxID=2968084 RepID=A0ABY5L181_9CELL|nr:cytochrome c oxidase assembly protein [Cellulomonas chengniuliangii]MCC2309235.1 bifunctional copper resistance protein CopD/cytochrome c oxidase assembly protein [Cellulomonas chengniuliangii]UUI75190.1 bifunctional copper resistance protein CopD/cytochrome c oxidase assembly protein [Cellulomonas chengniuliangii]